MSNHIVIKENDSYNLKEDRHVNICNELLKENPDLLFTLRNNELVFDDYVVGTLQIDDLIIEIKSRNDLFQLDTIFEMIFFLKTDGFDKKMDVLGYQKDSSFGVNQIASSYCGMCEKFVQYGLNGDFIDKTEKSKYLKGKINFKNFNKKEIVFKGLEVNFQQYSLNSFENKLIKAALTRLLVGQSDRYLRARISSLLREFDFIETYSPKTNELRSYEYHSQFSNPYYSMMTEYSIIILDNLKLNFKGGNLTGSSFLVNSNTLFEKYIYKVLSTGLKEKIEKWDVPRDYASINYKGVVGRKSFSPDILVDYEPESSSCRVVLDVKNKYYSPGTRKLSDVVKSPDIYQIIFYCNQLKTNCGGLIYPSNESFEPLKLIVEDRNDLIIFLISMNMKKSMSERNAELLSYLKKDVFVYT